MGQANKGEPWLDDVFVEHSDSSSGYFRVALEFARGAELVHTHGAAPMPSVVGENAAHSTELALRAFLLSRMKPVQVKKISSRHNLEKLWTKAAQKNLAIDPIVPRWCKGLNAAHGDPYLFRYPKHGTGVVLPGEALQELRKLLGVVADALHLDASGNAAAVRQS
jgi:hypothetical protein